MNMKKLALLFIVLTILVGTTTFVSAASTQAVPVVLSDTPSTVTPGEAVVLEAVCERNGSSYNIVWSNATEGQTVFSEETGCYTSEAVFQADIPGIYTISYEITMYAGNSGTTFIGRVERTIEVISTVTLAGADIRNLTVTPVYRSDGSIAYYEASGKIYSLWSDGTAVAYGSVYFGFGAYETSKNINVTIYDNGIQYVYIVTVNR
jgi:hypothetical protein